MDGEEPAAGAEEDEQIAEEDIVEVYKVDNDGDAPDERGVENGQQMHVQEEEDASTSTSLDEPLLVFSGHEQDVFCVTTAGSLAATGGEDDRAFVFRLGGDASSSPVYHLLSGHSDSVVCVAFKQDAGRLATGDMSGKIRVWDTSKMASDESHTDPPSLLCETGTGADLHWLRWHPSGADVLLAGDDAGAVWMWLVSAKAADGLAQTKVFAADSVPCVDGDTVPPDSKRLCAVYADGSARLWSLKEGSNTTVGQPWPSSEDAVEETTSAAVHCSQPLVAVGGSKGSIKLCHYESGKVAAVLQAPTYKDQVPDASQPPPSISGSSVESLAFNSMNFLASGTSQGRCCVWDVSTTGCRCVPQLPPDAGSVTRVRWLRSLAADAASDFVLLTATCDGCVRTWDARTGAPIKTVRCHNGPVFDVAVNFDRQLILTVGGDSTCRVFALSDLLVAV